MLRWLWLPLIITAVILLIVIVWKTLRPAGDSVLATYPGAVEFGGSVNAGRATFGIVQWMSDPANPRPCPLVIHLPGGDLGGGRA